MPHVAGGGLGSFNHRFAQPDAVIAASTKTTPIFDMFPLHYGEETDPFHKRKDGILNIHAKSKSSPRSCTRSRREYWHRSGSLVHTDSAEGPRSHHSDTSALRVRRHATWTSRRSPSPALAKTFPTPPTIATLTRLALPSRRLGEGRANSRLPAFIRASTKRRW